MKNKFGLCARLASFCVLLQPLLAAPPQLLIEEIETGQIRLSWSAAAAGFRLEQADSLAAPAQWRPVNATPANTGGRLSVTIQNETNPRFYRLRGGISTAAMILETSPAREESGVAVTRETIFRLSAPLAANATLTQSHLFAEFGGRRLLSRPELSTDRRTATLFYLENLPASARVKVSFVANGIGDESGNDLDADGDGAPGGIYDLRFTTAGTAALSNTAVVGHVFASAVGEDGANRPLEGVIVTVDGAEESLRTTTDASGFFKLQPAPAGRFFVHVDGRTSIGSQWPIGAYYPFVGKAWEAVPGKTNNLAGGTGEIFLPLIQGDALKAVSATEETKITFSQSILSANPSLAGVEVRVPANTLFSENGTRGGKVGIAPVPPDRLPEPLPPGLNLPLVITIQTDGPQNFDRPVPVRFPNLPDPTTGVKLPPGAKTVLWSFNHDTGRWEPQGTATITADGNFAETDPGVGVRQPGWHGVSPATEPEKKPDPPDPPDPPDLPDPPDDPCQGQFGHYDCDKDGCAETSEPCEEECEKLKEQAKHTQEYCPLSVPFNNVIEQFFECPLLGDCPDPAWRKKFLQCREQYQDELAQYHICASKRGGFSLHSSRPHALALQPLESVRADQLQLIEAAARPFDLLLGSSEFMAIEPQEATLAQAVLRTLSQAYNSASPGGRTITDAERAEINALPLPVNLTPQLVANAINRLNAFFNGTMGVAERQGIENARTDYDLLLDDFRARGWRTPFDGFYRLDSANA
ncbi:MAG: carboxypeptidase-like regulatory domain-containing protein, partial [Verrucomicrobiales bacterium]|nr:carboxypeptidase-like regulatory domain-containing protein [Verrucomicrobiales bacterium]